MTAPAYPIEVTNTVFILGDAPADGSIPTARELISGFTAAVLPPGVKKETLAETKSRFDFSHTAEKTGAAASASSPERTDLWRIEATGENNRLKKFSLHFTAVPDFSDWRFRGSVDSLAVEPQTVRNIVGSSQQFAPLSTLQGWTSFDFAAQRDKSAPEGFRYELAGTFFRGNLVLSILEHPITDLFVEYAVSNDSIQVKRLTGRSGSVLLLADYSRTGTGADSHSSFRTQLEEFPLSDKTLEIIRQQGDPSISKFLDLPQLRGFSFKTTAKLMLVFDETGGKWQPREIGLACRDLSAEGGPLPKRISGLTGRLVLDERENLTFEFESSEEPKALKAVGVFASVLSDPVGEVRLEAADQRLDSSFLESLPEACRDEIAALHPSGTVNLTLSLRRTRPISADGKPKAAVQNYRLTVDVRDGAIQYDRFPYPISQITGQIECQDGVWTFGNFHGTGGNAEFTASGGLNEESSGGWLFSLGLKIARLPLGEELSAAVVNPQQKQLLNRMHVAGKADVDVRITLHTAQDQFDLEFDAVPVPGTVSMQPDYFPYELKNLSGTLHFRDGEITIENLRGNNGPMTFHAEVASRFAPDGTWQIHLMPVNIEQLPLDRQLENAVPPSLRNFVSTLKLAGYFNINGDAVFRVSAPNAPMEALWDSEVIFQQNTAQLVKPIESICGKARIWGQTAEGIEAVLGGELNLDSLVVQSMQITHLTGPFYYQNRELMFGNTAPTPDQTPLMRDDFFRSRFMTGTQSRSLPFSNGAVLRGQTADSSAGNRFTGFDSTQTVSGSATPLRDPSNPFQIMPQNTAPNSSAVSAVSSGPSGPEPFLFEGPDTESSVMALSKAETALSSGRPLRANLFDGELNLNGRFFFNDPVTYQVGLFLRNGSLPEIGRDLAHQTQPINGQASVYADLQGEGRNIGTLKGNGGLIVTDADLYEVPQFLKIFQSLSVQEPDQAAFNSCYVDFQVFGNQLTLKRVTLEGNSLMLFGDGTLTLVDGEQLLDLTMNSRIGNTKNRIPVVSDLIGGAGDQISQVRIEGPLSDPSVWREGFPGIKKAWWSIFPETAPDPNAKPQEKKRIFGNLFQIK